MHVSATPYSGNPGRGAGKTRRGTGPWRMEDGGWRLEAEARDYCCTTTSQSSIDCPFALSLPPEQKNQGGKAPSLVLLATYVPSALSMASQPSPLGAPVLTSQQANLTEYSLHFTHPSPRCLSILVSCSAVTTTSQTVVLVRFCSQGDRPGHSGTDGGDKIKQTTAAVRHQDQGSRATSTRLATRARRQQSVWSLSLRWEDTSENHHAPLNFPQAP